MGNTYGDFFISVACGNAPARVLSEHESKRAHQELCEEIAPAMEELREEEKQKAQNDFFFLMD